jgi:glycerophosphoryl diester phosphodiesterase
MRNRGVLVVVWVVNEEEEFLEVLNNFGDSIDGIMTDRPSDLKSFVERNKTLINSI